MEEEPSEALLEKGWWRNIQNKIQNTEENDEEEEEDDARLLLPLLNRATA